MIKIKDNFFLFSSGSIINSIQLMSLEKKFILILLSYEEFFLSYFFVN